MVAKTSSSFSRRTSPPSILILDSIKRIKGDIDLPWLELDKGKMQGSFLGMPERDQIDQTIKEQLVVELYSK